MGMNSVHKCMYDLSCKAGLDDRYGFLSIQDVLQFSKVG